MRDITDDAARAACDVVRVWAAADPSQANALLEALVKTFTDRGRTIDEIKAVVREVMGERVTWI